MISLAAFSIYRNQEKLTSRLFSMRLLAYIIFLLGLAACSSNNDELLNLPTYEGPIQEFHGSTILYSDSAVVKIKIDAPVRYDYESGDQEFAQGIYIEFYDVNGDLTNTLKADYCYYNSEEKVYRATGDVVVKGLETREQLNTEELFWNPETEKIYTEKFVRIETDGEITMGHGLEAEQDFSSYTIKKSSGSIRLNQ